MFAALMTFICLQALSQNPKATVVCAKSSQAVAVTYGLGDYENGARKELQLQLRPIERELEFSRQFYYFAGASIVAMSQRSLNVNTPGYGISDSMSLVANKTHGKLGLTWRF